MPEVTYLLYLFFFFGRLALSLSRENTRRVLLVYQVLLTNTDTPEKHQKGSAEI